MGTARGGVRGCSRPPGLYGTGRAGAPELLGHPQAGLHEGVEVDTGRDAETVQLPEQVLGREVAGGALGVRAAAQPAGAGVDGGDTVLQGDESVGEGLAVGVVEVHRQQPHIDVLRGQGVEQGEDLAGRADADRVAERQLVDAQVEQRAGVAGDDGRLDGALPRVAEAHRQVPAHRQALATRPGDHGREHRQRLCDRAVQVLPGKGLGRAAEHRDLPDTGLERAVQTLLVRHEHRQPYATGRRSEQSQQLRGVGQLGHPGRRHEAGGLHRRVPGRQQAPDELGLHLDVDDALLVLQPVARSDFVHRHARRQTRQGGHGMRNRGHGVTARDVTGSPGLPRPCRAAGRRRPVRRPGPAARPPPRRTAREGCAPSSSPPPGPVADRL